DEAVLHRRSKRSVPSSREDTGLALSRRARGKRHGSSVPWRLRRPLGPLRASDNPGVGGPPGWAAPDASEARGHSARSNAFGSMRDARQAGTADAANAASASMIADTAHVSGSDGPRPKRNDSNQRVAATATTAPS